MNDVLDNDDIVPTKLDMSTLLFPETIRSAFEALDRELADVEGGPFELFLVGGAALILLYGARASTQDVDAIVTRPEQGATVLDAARRIAPTLGLHDRWLSDTVGMYIRRCSDGSLVFDGTQLRVYAAAPEQLLAMKLSAWRDSIDIKDAKLLLSKLPGELEEVWAQIGGFLETGARAQARYNFEDLWESVHGPA